MTATTHPGIAGAETTHAGDAGKIAVWDLPTRVFHWSLALSFTGAFLTAESERWRDVHVMLGYTLLGLIVFRLIWGLAGSRYARFSSFVAGPARVKRYLASLLTRQPEHHVGHNPAGALAIVALLGLGLAISFSGLATYNDIGGEWLEDLHEGTSNAMLAVVVVHIAGVVVSSFMHRENLVGAMITGNKQGTPEQGIGKAHRWVGAALLLSLIGAWVAWGWSASTLLPGIGGTGQAATSMQSERHGGDGQRKRHRDDD